MTGYSSVSAYHSATRYAYPPDADKAAAKNDQPIADKAQRQIQGIFTGVAAVASSVAEDRAAASYDALELPPPAKLAVVQQAAVEQAWQAIAGALAAVRGVTAGTSSDKQEEQLSLKDLGPATSSISEFLRLATSVSAMQIRLLTVQKEFFLRSAGATESTMREIRENESISQKNQIQKELDAVEKNQEMQRKARKGQIFSLVASWVTATAQVVSGVAKLAVGMPQGALEIASGLTSVTNAILKTIVFCHPELKEKLQPHISRLDKAELALSIVGAAAGMVDFKKLASAATKIAGSTTEVIAGGAARAAANNGLANTLLRASRGTAQEAEMLCRNIGKAVAEEVAGAVKNIFTKKVLGFSFEKSFAKFFSKVVGPDAIAEIVSKNMVKVGQQMAAELPKEIAKEAAARGVTALTREAAEEVAEALARKLLEDATKNLTTQIQKDVGVRAMMAYSKLNASVTVAALATQVMSQAVGGAIGLQRADLQERLDKVLEQLMFMEMLQSVYTMLVESQKDQLDRRGGEYNVHQQNASANLSLIGQTNLSIAAAIV